MHILFALAGLHQVRRGAEVVFEAVAQEIALGGEHKVTLVGSGQPVTDRQYNFEHVPAVSREHFERWPKVPFLRSEFMYEEVTFAARLAMHPVLREVDVTVTCGYPYTNWALRRRHEGKRARHVFVTQNGDWPATARRGEPRFFSCDGLICTNPVYFERNHKRWRSALIPNGIDPQRFFPGPGERAQFGLPENQKVVLMVSALQPGKRVIEAMRAVASVKDAFLVIAGDGVLRDEVDVLAHQLLRGRFKRDIFTHQQMPALYRSADLFLHTTIGESFGNVYIEALSSGIPVLAHDEPVTRWILKDHALLVDTTLQSDLSEAIRHLLGADSLNRRLASDWARTTYSWSSVARRYLTFLEEISAERLRS
jgi:glycosyltransferase involved in cell wall biosynthesis